MADVFISYARGDQSTAARVAKGLQAAGYDVWWDADLPAHRSYSEVIERNLEAAKAVVVLWSKAAAQSQWVRAEADFARNAGKLTQGSVDGVVPPMPFNQIQCADLKGWRGAATHSGWARLRSSVQALVSGESEPRTAPGAKPSLFDRLWPARWWAAAGVVVLVAALASVLMFGRPSDSRKPVLAVMPFRTLNAQDESLVAGIWEDTRQAIGRNPQLVVLGPNTVEQLATKGESATQKAADFMLQASVRTAGDRVRVSADLVRTKDGEQVWTQDFDRKLDDVFALQSEIANEIEGRIRGRLAENGGVKPEHISTSGDVYALYVDARAKIRLRQGGKFEEAFEQLKKVVALDPNFAPGWATLAEATQLEDQGNSRDPEALARRAIELAPNLAAGHAVLALTLHLNGPIARAELERAVKLDPNDFESLNWLGNMQSDAGDTRGALESYSRAAEIEPLFAPAVVNKFKLLRQIGDQEAIDRFTEQERKLGAENVVVAMQMDVANDRGNLAEALNLGFSTLAKKAAGDDVSAIESELFSPILHLGFEDLSVKLGILPPFGPYLWRNDPHGLDMVATSGLSARSIFSRSPIAETVARVSVLNGRGRQLSDMYLSLNLSPEQFSRMGDPERFSVAAPTLVVALRDAGHVDEAKTLLAYTENFVNALPADTRNKPIYLARVYAVQGRKEDALASLTPLIARGWLPDSAALQANLYTDPAFASLRGDPRFEAVRNQMMATLARQKAQVDMNLVRKMGG